MSSDLENPHRRELFGRLFKSPSQATLTEFQRLPNLQPKSNAVLWAVAADRPDNIFIAGDEGQLFHFNGEQWQQEDIGSQLPVHSLCIDQEDVFSVGWLGRICVREHGQWRPLQGGQNDASVENHPLFDIERAQDGTLWAVGDHGRVSSYKAGEWQEVNSNCTAHLRAVLPLSDGRVLASGLQGTVLEYDDGGWQAIETDSHCAIVSMVELDAGTVLAVGGEYSVEQQGFVGRLFLYQERQWQHLEIKYPLPRLRRVRRESDGEQDNVLITGDNGVVFRWTHNGVEQLRTGVRLDLHDIVSFAPGEALVCGDGGAVFHETKATELSTLNAIDDTEGWDLISNGETVKTLRTAWSLGDGRVLIAGDGGTVLLVDGDLVTQCDTPLKHRIHDLWGSSPTNVFAACDNGVIQHYDGQTWSVVHQSANDLALLAIRGFGPHDIFAVGDEGQALRYDGLMWRTLETACKQELYALWGLDSQHALAVGGGGTVLRWNGSKWANFHAGTDFDLYGVAGTSLQKIFLCGLAGTLIRFENNAWNKDFTGVRTDLHSVCEYREHFYAVGSNGTILHKAQGEWQQEPCKHTNTLQTITGCKANLYAAGSGGVILRKKL